MGLTRLLRAPYKGPTKPSYYRVLVNAVRLGSRFGPRQLAVMWMQFNIQFYDGEEPFVNHFCLWFPTIANIGTIHLRIEIRVNPDTQAITGSLEIRHRGVGFDHYPDDAPETV
jgi:hypothetical protein